jgi:hypothetical protein
MRVDEYVRDLESRLDEEGRKTLEAFVRLCAGAAFTLDLVWEDNETMPELLARLARYQSALRMIAVRRRPDGTYNYDRRACEQIAEKALAETRRERAEPAAAEAQGGAPFE